jgi:hypothetical protein
VNELPLKRAEGRELERFTLEPLNPKTRIKLGITVKTSNCEKGEAEGERQPLGLGLQSKHMESWAV